MKISHSDVIILLGLLGDKCCYRMQTCFGYLYQVEDVQVHLKHPLIGCDPSSECAVVARWEALDQSNGASPSASYDYFLKLPAYGGGQNATTGTPNPHTGRMNKCGTLHVFSSKKLRDKFCDQYDYSFNCYPVPTDRKEAKSKYCAGQSQYNFDRDLLCINYSDNLVIDK